MSANNGKPAKKPKAKPRGKPFTKNDPRSNLAGNLNPVLQSYTINFRNALALKIPPDELAELVADDVRRHRRGAREFVADRLMGKVVQPVEQTGTVEHRGEMTIKVVHTKD